MKMEMTKDCYVLRLLFLFAVFYSAQCQCYFPMEFLGTYLMQTQTESYGHGIATFSEISFEPDAIPPWGKCFRKRGNNVILKDSTGGEDCMRCFHLTLKAPNVIQIHTEGLARCYTKEEAVRATCPDDRAVHERKFKEIMLYRKQEPNGNLAAEHVFCPISGKFRFTYTANNGQFRCDQTLSELSNCPLSNTLGVKFRQCSFADMDISFRCLGDWEGNNNDRYLALMDLRADEEERSKFRCGNLVNGKVNNDRYLALMDLRADEEERSKFRCGNLVNGKVNNDRYLALMDLRADEEERSKFRCGNLVNGKVNNDRYLALMDLRADEEERSKFRCGNLVNGKVNNDRYLALMDLRADEEERSKFRCGMYRVDPLTGRVFVSLSADSTCYNQLRSATDGHESLILTPFPEKSPPGPVLHAHCRFPDWVQGQWEDMQVVSNVLLYKDHSRLQRYSLTCLRRENDTPEDRFIVFSSTHCGEESYNCIWLKRRSINVMEFQIGSQPSHLYSDTLCHDMQFNDEAWITQGRLKPTQMFPCPITGDYTGVLPENPGLCAKVASDCNNPDVMFYTVSNCENKSQVFEEREYRCLGSWEEPGGVTFTYTQRREMDGFQCFSGKVLQSGKEAYIKEAGHSCIRGEDPLIYGMKITKHASCPDLGLSVSTRPRYPTVGPEDDPLYRPVPNDPFWYHKENDNKLDTKDRKSPTRSTKEEEHILNKSYKTTSGFLLPALIGIFLLF